MIAPHRYVVWIEANGVSHGETFDNENTAKEYAIAIIQYSKLALTPNDSQIKVVIREVDEDEV